MFKLYEEIFKEGRYPVLVQNLALFVVPLIAGILLRYLLSWLAKRRAKKTAAYSFFRSMITYLARPVTIWLPLLFIKISLPEMVLSPKWMTSLDKTLDIALTVTFAWVLINIVNVGGTYLFNRYDLSKKDNIRERKVRTQLLVIQRIVSGAIIFITIAFVLLSFDGVKKIGAGLLTGVGIGGIIVGFAAQRSLGNLFAGLHIAFTQPIRIDDVLIVEGQYGNVEEITLSYVVLRIWDSRRLILPITYFLEKPFENWTRTGSELLTTVFIFMDYTVPVTAVRDELTRLLNANQTWNKKVNTLVVSDAREHAIQLRALISADNSGNAAELQFYVREGLISFVQKNYPDALPKTRVVMEKVDTSSG
ncbi:mechanosensitive ion channel family protein [Taibaiella soli]|uniref:Mechanosensitive ion channel family protein n=1 Tax=Taibaiella soli TaxID=1649169 RepID=A0A2W2AR14_9BACT|nr:mechanosensitive ion channel family protein [Taibaiella soli]PZF74880.1 mechanosensitive ion channel family protein [Taibaiella soli]